MNVQEFHPVGLPGVHGNHIVVEAQSTSFRFLNFSSPDNFTMIGDVNYYEVNNSFLLNAEAQSLRRRSCGGLYYKDRVRLKDAASKAMASFNNSFTFSITSLNFWRMDGGPDGYSHADGMTFTFGRNNNNLAGAGGKYLCLVDEGRYGQPSN